MKVLFISLVVLVISTELFYSSEQTDNHHECRIYSSYYRCYLYARYKLLGWRRNVKLWDEEIDFKYNNLNDPNYTYTPKVYFGDNDPTGVWYFEPVVQAGRNHTFYIRNKKYSNEYLTGSDTYNEWFFKKQNRMVYSQVRAKDNDDDNEFFMWKLARLEDNVYHVWNVKLGLPLYSREGAREEPPSKGPNKRRRFEEGLSVYVNLWNDPRPYTPMFHWLLKCRDNRILDI